MKKDHKGLYYLVVLYFIKKCILQPPANQNETSQTNKSKKIVQSSRVNCCNRLVMITDLLVLVPSAD